MYKLTINIVVQKIIASSPYHLIKTNVKIYDYIKIKCKKWFSCAFFSNQTINYLYIEIRVLDYMVSVIYSL